MYVNTFHVGAREGKALEIGTRGRIQIVVKRRSQVLASMFTFVGRSEFSCGVCAASVDEQQALRTHRRIRAFANKHASKNKTREFFGSVSRTCVLFGGLCINAFANQTYV